MNKKAASPLERGEGCVLSLQQLINEAIEYRPGYNTVCSLCNYYEALIRTINHSANQTIIEKAKTKAAEVRMLLSIYNEGRN